MFKRGIFLVVSVILIPVAVAWGPTAAHAADSCGSARFTDGNYAKPGIWYHYIVDNGPPNTSGTLHVTRNGVKDPETPGWIQTDEFGFASKGPWTATSNETAVAYIDWLNGCTTNTITHINDVTPPGLDIDQNGGTGVPVPLAFSGRASDAAWGTGFNLQPGWSEIYGYFQDLTTGMYFNGTYYGATTLSQRNGTFSPAKAMNVTLRITPPAPTAHLRTHNYKWCAVISDRFFDSQPDCITINAPSNGI